MKCAICGIEVETIDKAIDTGWIPSFYEGEKEHGPVCSSCAETMIDMGEDGEMELKLGYYFKVRYLVGDYVGKIEEMPKHQMFIYDQRSFQVRISELVSD